MVEKIEINLLPVEYRVRKKSIKIPRAAVYPALFFITFVVGAGLYTIILKDKEASLKQDVETLTKEIQANKHIQAEINQLREQKRVTELKIRALERISVDREKWVRLLEVLSGNLPPFSWLMSVKEEVGDKLNIEARTYSFPEVAHYMSKLESTEYVKGVTLTGIDQIQGQDRKVYKFFIICALNRDVGFDGVLEEPVDTVDAKKGKSAKKSAGKSKKADQGGGGE